MVKQIRQINSLASQHFLEDL